MFGFEYIPYLKLLIVCFGPFEVRVYFQKSHEE